MRRRNGTVIALLMVLLCFLAAPAAWAAELRIIPAAASKNIGDLFSLSVQVDSAADLAGFQFDFSFVPTSLQVKSVTIAPPFGQTVTKRYDNVAGSGRIAAYTPALPSASGTNLTVATIEFTASGGGSFPVTLVKQVLGTAAGDEVPSTVAGSLISVAFPPTAVLDFKAGVGGTLTGTLMQTVNSGGSTTPVYAVPDPGYYFVNWSGTNGFITTADNPLIIISVTANQTITAAFATVVNGACGASNGAVFTRTPSTGLCSSGAVSGVTGSGPWNWNCAGAGGGTAASCSAAIESYAITFQSGGNGGVTGATSQTVTYGGSTSAVTAVAAPGYHFVNWSGTGGFVTTTNNPLITTSVTATQVITATFAADPVNGVCGASNGAVFTIIPSTGLCSSGTASGVTGSDPWRWNCAGTGGGTTATCSTASDITAPLLSVSTLVNGAITNNATLNISGTVSDASGISSLTINSTATTFSGGSFSYPLTLQAGPNTITIVATDTLGNTATDIRTITLDTAAPVLTISAPADTSMTAQSAATVSGTISETSVVTVTLNGGTPQTATVTGNSFSATVTLSAGLNSISVTARDLAGNTAGAVRTVTYDNTSPSLAITSPNQDVTTGQNSITINGTVSDTITATTISISFNNLTYTPAIAGGIFSQPLTIPSEGTYVITATATDAAGNSSSVSRNVIYAIPVNGACGTSNNTAQTAAPTADLCSSGTASGVTGSGPWNWSCTGSKGGASSSCSASLTAPVDTVVPVVTEFIISPSPGALTVVVGSLTATDAFGVTGYLVNETAVPPLVTDPAWSETVPSTYNCRTWGNNTLYAYSKDAAGNISAPTRTVVLIGPTDGIIVPAAQKLEPTLEDALKSLNFAMKVITPTPEEFAGANVSPLVHGIPQPPGGKKTINLGDTIVTLRRVVGL